jgi:hypothetical protein
MQLMGTIYLRSHYALIIRLVEDTEVSFAPVQAEELLAPQGDNSGFSKKMRAWIVLIGNF